MQQGHGNQRRPDHGTWLRLAGVTPKLQGGSKRREEVVGGRGGVMVAHRLDGEVWEASTEYGISGTSGVRVTTM